MSAAGQAARPPHLHDARMTIIMLKFPGSESWPGPGTWGQEFSQGFGWIWANPLENPPSATPRPSGTPHGKAGNFSYHVYSPTMNYPDKLYERMLLFYKVKIFNLKISLFECHIGRLYLTPRDSGF